MDNRIVPGTPRKIVETVGANELLAPEHHVGLTLSPRQQRLNWLWSIYTKCQYDSREFDFDGTRRDPWQREQDLAQVSSAGNMPGGYYSPSLADVSAVMRKPTAPSHLGAVIVDRFTGLLFSERRHPQIEAHNPIAAKFAIALADSSRLWAACIKARNFGGGIGTFVVGFVFDNGLPVIEVHDPRWCVPRWRDRRRFILESVEIRYQYPVEVFDDMGYLVEVPHWYRRVITSQTDVRYMPTPVVAGPPDWQVAERVDHGFGFCPVVWGQNLPIDDDIDGQCDAAGTFDSIEKLDLLLSMATRGVLKNTDPTLVISTDQAMDGVAKGSDSAVKLDAAGKAAYLTLPGDAAAAATALADKFRAQALEIAQCVLENPGQHASSGARTATEISRIYEAMTAKADVLREQYGQSLVLPLLGMMIRAAGMLATPKLQGGKYVAQTLRLRGKDLPTMQEIGKIAAATGDGTYFDLRWPAYFDTPMTDVLAATNAAVNAKSGEILSREAAAAFLAPLFDVADVAGMLKIIDAATAKRKSDLEAMAMPSRDDLADDDADEAA